MSEQAQSYARWLAETQKRIESQESTAEITKGPSKAQPIPVEPAFEVDEDESGE